MSKVIIYANGTIGVGSNPFEATITGYCVCQASDGTKVLAWHNNGHRRPRALGAAVAMPRQRYVLSHEAGLAQFEADFLAIWNAAPASEEPEQ